MQKQSCVVYNDQLSCRFAQMTELKFFSRIFFSFFLIKSDSGSTSQPYWLVSLQLSYPLVFCTDSAVSSELSKLQLVVRAAIVPTEFVMGDGLLSYYRPEPC